LHAFPLSPDQAGDSTLLFEDGAVAETERRWRVRYPDALPIDPEVDDAPEPTSSASDFVEVIDVHGRWVSWAHALDIDVDVLGPHVHQRQRGVVSLVTGARATLDSLVSPEEASRLRAAGRAAFDTVRAVIARAGDERATEARATLHTFSFVDNSFTLADSAGVPAIVFHVAGTDSAGHALELTLPPLTISASERTSDALGWSAVQPTLPEWERDSTAVTWRSDAVVVRGRLDATGTTLALAIGARANTYDSVATSVPIAVVPRPVYQFIDLRAARVDEATRAALRAAFDRARGDDPFATRAMAPDVSEPLAPTLPSALMSASRPSRTVAESMHVSSELIMPQDANILGHVFGGAIMAMVDKAAAVAAFRHARTNCVTASIDRVDFREPIHVGELVSCHASVNFVGNTSMEVGVRVEAEDLISGIRRHTNTCYLTFVAIDRNGRPVPIPQVVPETPEQQRRFAAAQERRRRRLEERQAEARTS
jgi:acyl-CoA hydrolase